MALESCAPSAKDRPWEQPLAKASLVLCAQATMRCKSNFKFSMMGKRKGSSLGLPAVNELIWGKKPSENEPSLPRVARVLCAAHPTSVFYAVLRLLVPGARRQVYEIKAQRPINNLAAYCKKTYTQYNSYYLQQSDMYIHFKCTSLPPTCFHLMWSPKPNKEEKKHVTSTLCLRPAL